MPQKASYKRTNSKRSYKPSKKSYKAKRVTKRRGKYAARPATGAEVLSSLGGYALTKLKARLGLNTESKYVDTPSGSLSATGTLTQVFSNMDTLIPLGTNDNTRNGSSVRMTNYVIQGHIVTSSANLQPSKTRVIVVDWGSTPAASANVADILEVTTDVDSCYTHDPTFKHTVLMDEVMYFNPDATGNAERKIDLRFRMTPLAHHLVWTTGDTTGASANLLRGFVALYCVVDQATAAQFPALTAYQRVEYVDN